MKIYFQQSFKENKTLLFSSNLLISRYLMQWKINFSISSLSLTHFHNSIRDFAIRMNGKKTKVTWMCVYMWMGRNKGIGLLMKSIWYQRQTHMGKFESIEIKEHYHVLFPSVYAYMDNNKNKNSYIKWIFPSSNLKVASQKKAFPLSKSIKRIIT